MRKVESAFFRIVLRRSPLSAYKLTLITPRASEKSAVKRNLVRRRAREWLRKNFSPLLTPTLRGPVELSIFFKKEAFAATKKRFYEELKSSIVNILSS